MPSPHVRPAIALAVWSLLVWTTRIRNIWTDDTLTTAGQLWRTALALAFTAFALAVLTVLRKPVLGRVVRTFAGFTTAVWVVRAVQIAVADHDGGFIAVHTALAIASIALAWWADRAVRKGAPTVDDARVSVNG